jgi:protein SCO1/2/putative membrane protein
MAQYADIYSPGDADRWLFCTGEPDKVWQLIRSGFKVSAWEEAGTRRQPGMEFAHSNHLVHVSPEGQILGRYNAVVEEEVATLAQVLTGRLHTPEKHQPANIALLEQQQQERLREAEVARAVPVGDPLAKLPAWAKRLPATNAMLNGLATLLLVWGFLAIKARQPRLHKQLMLTAFVVSGVFLASYLTYHGALSAYTESHGKKYAGPPQYATIYYGILISHVILAAVVPVGAIGTIWQGLKENWPAHRRWAKITYPIWLYVSVTGVVIYWMLYQL